MGPTGANQPLSFNPQAVASSTGGATFSFPAVPNGQIWTGTVTVIGAPDCATMTISSIHLGNDIGQFIGGNNWGPLQLQSGDQLIVTATGLVSGTAYVCNFQGTGITGGDPGITYPEAYAHSMTTRTEQIVLGSGSTPITSGAHSGLLATLGTFQLNPAYRSIYVVMWFVYKGTGSASFTPTLFYANCVGQQSNLQYENYTPQYFNTTPVGSLSTGWTFGSVVNRFPVVAGADTTVQINAFLTATAALANTSLYWIIGADLAQVDAAVYSETPNLNAGVKIATNYGGLPIENLQWFDGVAWNVDPLQVSLTNTVGTPFFVETVSGSTTAVTNTSAGPLYVNNTPTTVTPATSSSSGTTASSLIAIKTSAGTLYGIYLFNNSTTANTYLQVWNLGTGSITIGTTAPLYSFGVPYGGGAYIPFPEPIAMSTAITIAATTTRAGSTYATTGLDYDIIYV